MQNLCKWKLPDDNICTFCHEIEATEHLHVFYSGNPKIHDTDRRLVKHNQRKALYPLLIF